MVLLACASAEFATADDAKPTAKPRGGRIGGVIKSDKGQPIEGAKVIINSVVRDDVGQFVTKEIGKATTDSAGKWSSDSAPDDATGLNFQLSHPNFRPAEYDQADAPGDKSVSKKDLLASKAVMVLESAIHVEGTVTDNGGGPISGATIIWENSDDPPKKRTLKSDEKGHFSFTVLEPGDASLVVQAKGHAPAFQRVSIERGLELTFVLGKGQTIKGWVRDAEGKPVPGANVSVASWNDTSLLNWRQLTDAGGRFSWDSAPEGRVMLSVTKNGYNPATAARESGEMEVPLNKTFLLAGKVVDAETKEPIKAFTLTRGYGWGANEEDHVNWERYDQKHGKDGEYSFTFPDHRGGRIKVMVEANGYLPAATKLLPENGWHTNDFELKKGSGPKGVVKSPDGKPVEDAQVAILSGGYMSLGAAEFKNFNESEKLVVKTDAQGRFALAASLGSAQIIAVHESGYAEASPEKLEKEPTVTLQPWGRIEGVFKIGKQPGTNEMIMVAPKQNGPGSLNYDWENFKTDTDEQGRFAFEKVPPGERQLVRLIPQAGNSWSWSHILPITVKSGETTQITYGGTGRQLVGKAKLSDPDRKVDWQSGHNSLNTRSPKPPKSMKGEAQVREWQNSPAYKEAMTKQRYYTLRFSPDGTFRIDDVPAGDYTLNIHLTEPREDGNPGTGTFIGSANKDVVVPEMPGGRSDEPLDIGTIEIKVKKEIKLGIVAPAFETKTLDGKPLKLADYRGKFVLLDFWATWCGPCVAEIPKLKETYDAFSGNERFAMISLSLDPEVKSPQKFVKEKELKWTQGFLGEWSETDLPNSYGVQGIPAVFLIDPEGKIVAKNIRGEAIHSAVEKAIGEKKSAAN